MTDPLPAVGPTLGVARHLHLCPLCGGPNPHLADPPPEPEFAREPLHPPLAQSPHQQAAPPELGAAADPAAPDPLAALDHPAVGGKFTVCVLCYGPHPELARRCVGSILATLPVGRYDLRVAANAACPETLEYLRTVPATKLYVHEENRFKYPVMREMFRDPDAPLATPYLVWFDDDSYARDPLWAARLAKAVAENHRHGVRLFGARFTHDPSAYARPGHDPYAWFRSAPWWRGVPHGTRRDDRPAAGGRHVHFVAGGFWAASVDALRQADVPDARLRHNGGDITIGEQMRQAGYRLGVFDQDKVLVGRSMTPRRGYSEDFPWAGAQPPRPGSRLT